MIYLLGEFHYSPLFYVLCGEAHHFPRNASFLMLYIQLTIISPITYDEYRCFLQP